MNKNFVLIFGFYIQMMYTFGLIGMAQGETLSPGMVNLKDVKQTAGLFLQSLQMRNREKNIALDELKAPIGAAEEFISKLSVMDPHSICEISTHAGELPVTVCDIIKHLKMAKDNNQQKLYHNRFVFFGPPGTGKTTLAKAIADLSGSYFIKIHAATAVTEMQGSGAKEVKDKFEEAKKEIEKGKTVVIFVDEIDAVGREREQTDTHKDLTNTFLALQTYSDDYENEPRIVVILATNKREILDKALKSRFRSVEISQPDEKMCAQIFLYYFRNYDCKHDFGDKVYEFAKKAKEAGLSGRNIKYVVQDAKWESVKRSLDKLQGKFISEQIKVQEKINKQEEEAKKRDNDDKDVQSKLTRIQLEHYEHEMKNRTLNDEILQLQKKSLEIQINRASWRRDIYKDPDQAMALAGLGIQIAGLFKPGERGPSPIPDERRPSPSPVPDEISNAVKIGILIFDIANRVYNNF